MGEHCASFWRKWKEEPNFCGLSQKAVQDIEFYRDTVSKLCSYGFTEDIVHKCFKQSYACNPIFRGLKEGSPIKSEIIDNIIKSLSSQNPKTKFTVGMMKKLIDFDNMSEEDQVLNYSPQALKILRKEKNKRLNLDYYKPETVAIAIFKKTYEVGLNERKSLISGCLSKGQYGILVDLVNSGHASDEYGAFCLTLKWAAERLEAEKAAKETNNGHAL